MDDIAIKQVISIHEERRRIAMLTGDVATLRDLFDSSLVYIHSTGTIDSYSTYIEKLEKRLVSYEALTLEIRVVSVGPRLAVVRGEMDAVILTPSGQHTVSSEYDGVWSYRTGEWRLLVAQGYKRPRPKY